MALAATLSIAAGVLLLGSSLMLDEKNREEIFTVSARQYKAFVEEGKLESRFYISRDPWKMFADKPVWGWGLGSYAFIINDPDKYLGPEHEGKYEHAHNDWLQYMAETGTAGFLLLAIIILSPFFTYRRNGRANPVSNWLWGSGFVLLAYAFVEFPCRTPAVAVHLTIFIAAGTKYSLLERQMQRPA